MPHRQTGLVTLVSLTFLVAMTLIRVMLGIMTPAGSGLTLSLLVKAAGAGLVFDLATLAYALFRHQQQR